jgi:para-nitrobenzyl esterase
MTADMAVETGPGKLRGAIHAGIHSFKGIPYAQPTAGAARFMPPIATVPWTGIKDALALGHQAPQPVRPIRPANAWIRDTTPTGEDCLALNVYTPAVNDGGKRPVMVWMHGGGYFTGSGGATGLDGANLAKRGEVVVVTLNHRLNAFGYNFLGEFGDERFADAGNAGMLDIVMALEWVRDNIGAFGGDTDNVTIFGQSGGGSKVAVLMTMPSAKGLFHKAVMQSSSSHLRLATKETASRAARQLLGALGLDDAAALQLAASDRMLEGYAAAVAANYGNDSFRPVVDGRSILNHPFDLDAPNLAADIPLLIGSCETEKSFYDITLEPEKLPLSAENLHAQIKRFVGIDAGRARDLIADYTERRGEISGRDLFNVLSSDHMYRRNAITAAEIKSQQGGASAYLYEFTWKTPALGGMLKTPHTLCIPFVFGNVEITKEFTGTGSEQTALMDTVMETWLAFARTGNPNNTRLPEWAPYDAADRTTMIFDNDCAPVQDPKREDRLTINACPQFISDRQWSAAA